MASKLKKDGTPDRRKGKAMALTPKKTHPWKKPYAPFETARERAKRSGFKP